MTSPVIVDGMSRPGYIPPRNGVNSDPIRFSYRPLSSGPRARNRKMVSECDDSDEAELTCCCIISEQLESWSVTYPDQWEDKELRGKQFTHDARMIFKYVDPYVVTMIYSIIMGFQASPPDPQASAEEFRRTQDKSRMPNEKLRKLMEEEESERLGNSKGE